MKYSILQLQTLFLALALAFASSSLAANDRDAKKNKTKEADTKAAKAARSSKPPKGGASKFNTEADIARQLNDTPPAPAKAPAPSPATSSTTTTAGTAPAHAPKSFHVEGSGYKGEGKVDSTGKIQVTLIGSDGKPFMVTMTPRD
ncbi:MAG TPA: hypothetical protein VK970_16940 [Candidatus Methylacidiphilales bacterium]|nr:hypothetical protein [Candidatus Methylacidiphilales bacterium]